MVANNFNVQHALTPSIVRVNAVVDVFVHAHVVRGLTVCPDGSPATNHSYMKCGVIEAGLAQQRIRLHHYPLQSLDFFMQVKHTRGDVATKRFQRVRDRRYFRARDKLYNAQVDRTLAQRSPCVETE